MNKSGKTWLVLAWVVIIIAVPRCRYGATASSHRGLWKEGRRGGAPLSSGRGSGPFSAKDLKSSLKGKGTSIISMFLSDRCEKSIYHL